MKFTRDEIRSAMLLYAVTDRTWLDGRTPPRSPRRSETGPPSSRSGRRAWTGSLSGRGRSAAGAGRPVPRPLRGQRLQ